MMCSTAIKLFPTTDVQNGWIGIQMKSVFGACVCMYIYIYVCVCVCVCVCVRDVCVMCVSLLCFCCVLA